MECVVRRLSAISVSVLEQGAGPGVSNPSFQARSDMSSTPLPAALGDLLRHPAHNLLAIAVAAAAPGGEVEGESLALMRRQVDAGLLDQLTPGAVWPIFVRGLMAAAPSGMLQVLRACGALQVLLPELEALFGMPQSADDPPTVDLGEHVLRSVDAAARQQAPLSVRFAALVFNVGKSDSPPEHLPFHYRHMERGLPRIQVIAARFGVPPDGVDLAVLALHEVERIHRAAPSRAGSIAAMLERLDAFARRDRFDGLLAVCSADYRAYPGRATRSYPKAALLNQALDACIGIAGADGGREALLEARALAIAAALRSARWSETGA